MGLDEHHQITKAYEHHNIDILVHGVVGLIVESSHIGSDSNKDPIKDNKDQLIDDSLNDEASHWAPDTARLFLG